MHSSSKSDLLTQKGKDKPINRSFLRSTSDLKLPSHHRGEKKQVFRRVLNYIREISAALKTHPSNFSRRSHATVSAAKIHG
jgi:hypothetical protein